MVFQELSKKKSVSACDPFLKTAYSKQCARTAKNNANNAKITRTGKYDRLQELQIPVLEAPFTRVMGSLGGGNMIRGAKC